MDFLEIAEVQAVMQVLQVSNIPLVLVGGQAVNFWAFHYSTDAPEWQEHTPYASRDIDFLGSVGAAEQVAKVLGGKITRNENMEDGVTAAVVTVARGGKTILIDVLSNVFGLDAEEVEKKAVLFESLTGGYGTKVMNPFMALRGKLACLRGLPQGDRQDEKHVRLCLLAIEADISAYAGNRLMEERVVLDTVDNIFKLAFHEYALDAWYKYGIRVKECLPWPILDRIQTDKLVRFREQGKPHRLQQLEKKRDGYTASQQEHARKRERKGQ